MQRSRGTGPRATVSRTAPFTVGRGPVPRHAAVYRTLAGDRPPRYGPGWGSLPHAPFGIRRSRTTVSGARGRSRGTGPRATVPCTAPFYVGRGPVPRHAALAGETLLDAHMASEGPRATGKRRCSEKNLTFTHKLRKMNIRLNLFPTEHSHP